MGVRILYNDENAVMYSSSTDWAFGPVFSEHENHTAEDRLELFLEWLGSDPRRLNDAELEAKYSEWRQQESAQWSAKENEDGNYLEEEKN